MKTVFIKILISDSFLFFFFVFRFSAQVQEAIKEKYELDNYHDWCLE